MKKAYKQLTSSDSDLSTTITGLSHDGRGIATLKDGKTTFIRGALPGESVRFKLTRKHTKYNEGEVIEILSASADRATPPCEHFGTCGGCSLQHLSMTAQIKQKEKTLQEQLKHFGKVEPDEVVPPLFGSPLNYRRKARLGVLFHRNTQSFQVGFREKDSNRLTNLNRCEILDARVGNQIPAIKNLVESLSQSLNIPQVEIAASDETVALVIRHLTALTDDDIKKLTAFGAAHHFHIYLQPSPPARVHKIWPLDDTELLSYSLKEHDICLQFHPLDFTQINSEINPRMIQQALDWLDLQKTDTVLDLFCGLGNFTLPIARYAEHVVGIEGSDDMVKRAQKNAELNQLTNTEFHTSNLVIVPRAQPTWMKKSYDKILLDPPRSGAKEMIDLFPKFAAKKIVYVSCNPATLARDAGELVHKHGYKLKKVGVINMFPHTSHIEAIALFSR